MKHLLIVGGAFLACAHLLVAQIRPNFILIMTDDHAKNAISLYNTRLISTPNIDRIGSEGVAFRKAFVTNSICSPSRAVHLTGKYSHLNGVRDNRDPEFDGSQLTFPKVLQGAGYRTILVGKWHLGSVPTGFDYWNILIGQGQYYNPRFVEMGDTVDIEGYVTDIITDVAIRQLEEADDRPFCLLLHQKAPHRNWMPDLKHLTEPDSVTMPLPETFHDDYSTRSAAAREQDMEIRNMYRGFDMKLYLPEGEKDPGTGGNNRYDARQAWENTLARFTELQKAAWDNYYKPLSDAFYRQGLQGKELEEWMYQRYIKDYLKTITSVDENIGRLLTYLDQKGILDKTVILYTSDQGFFLGEHGWYDKRFMYEESIGIPLLVRFPRAIPPGVVDTNIVLNLDIAPTVIDLAGLPIPREMQGQSLVKAIGGDHGWRDAYYYHYYEYPHGWHDVKKHYGIRTHRHKLIHFYDDIDEWELYDLQDDPLELMNLYADPGYAELIADLKRRLYILRQEVGDID